MTLSIRILGLDPGLSAMPAALRSDLPRPSIIVGDLAIMAAIGPRGPLGLPFALREAIRQLSEQRFGDIQQIKLSMIALDNRLSQRFQNFWRHHHMQRFV